MTTSGLLPFFSPVTYPALSGLTATRLMINIVFLLSVFSPVFVQIEQIQSGSDSDQYPDYSNF